jgi:Asp-tRNA(Asn)/Glu-tRNA(Gln) amidotransferase A subunit family amidase
VEIAAGIRNGPYSSTEVVDAYLERIADRDETLNAFITVFEQRARSAAKRADQAIQSDEEIGQLHGVPVAIKDSRAVAGERHTWGTRLLSDNVATEDDLLVSRLREAGAIVVGKTNLPEFALTGGTDNLLIGPTANPFDEKKMVGGSSGGSAAAVAAGLVPVAHGDDGGGSLRIPASTCGIFTIKPTFGLVPNVTPGRTDAFGHTPMQSAGPMARCVEDAALMLDVLSGAHPGDPFSVPAGERSYRDAIHDDITGLEIALSPNMDLYPIDSRVRTVVEAAASAFEEAGATVSEVTLDFDHSREAITNAFMCQSNVLTTRFGEQLESSYDIDITGEDRDAVLSYIIEQFEAGRDTSALAYKNADVVRTDVLDTIEQVFADYDLLVGSTLMVPPFDKALLREQPGPSAVDGTQLDDSRWGMLIDWRSTQLSNLTGHPAASIPAGFVNDLPVGMEIVGPHHRDTRVLAASETYEEVRPWQQAYDDIE